MSADKVKESISKRLKKGLEDKGWTQADLSKATGVSPMLVSSVVRGVSEPSIATLIAFADALEVPIDEFFPDEKDGH